MPFTFPYRKCLHSLLITLGLIFSQWSSAHDIPTSLTIHAYIKPDGGELHLLLRVPMEALSEVDFPTRGPGYLEFSELDPVLRDAALTYVADSVTLYEEGQPLADPQLRAIRVSLPTNRSFTTYENAVENFAGPALDDQRDLYWNQGMLDTWLSYPIESAESDFAIESNLDRLGLQTTTVLRFVLPDGGERLFNYIGNPGRVDLDPSLWNSIWRFVALGFEHILDGLDHLLFLLCLVIPLRSMRALIPVITAFTVAHSITLISSAFGLVPNVLWFAPFIETLIALSIVYMAFENMVGVDFRNRWMITFGFGLVHGFGFSLVLAETMQFAGGHLLSALLAFNLGVEFGQLFVLIIVVPILTWFFNRIQRDKIAVILLSALVAHTAWHWMLERGAAFLQYEIIWPTTDLAFFVGLLRWLMLLVVIAGAVWIMFGIAKKFQTAESTN